MVTSLKSGRPGYSQGEVQRLIRAFRAEGREVELLIDRATGDVRVRSAGPVVDQTANGPTGATSGPNSTTEISHDSTTNRRYDAPKVADPGGLTLEQWHDARKAGRRS